MMQGYIHFDLGFIPMSERRVLEGEWGGRYYDSDSFGQTAKRV